MSFSESTVKEAWDRAGGMCECKRSRHVHDSKCNKILLWNHRGDDDSPFGWEAHHKTAVSSGGDDTLSNCEILCIECHKKTGSYGR